MRALRGSIPWVFFLVLTSPAVAFATGIAGETGETLWDWIVRLLAWTAGGWHYY